jgi:predicted NBD/HSP70 family sugar kinase
LRQYGADKNSVAQSHQSRDMEAKADSELVRRQNRRLVLDALRRNGPLARVELGRVTGLSPATITAISSQLIAERIIEELQSPLVLPANAKRGRPVTQLALRAKAAHVLALNISIDTTVLALADYAGTLLTTEKLHTPTYCADPASFALSTAEAIRHFLNAAGRNTTDIMRFGIAIQGVADSREGSIVWSPAFAARDVPLGDVLERELGIPCFVANDANMMAEGFLASEATARNRTLATIFTGYGVGMGLIIDGRVYHGASGGASEFGHMNHVPYGALCRCGRRGCIEAYAADYGILRTASGGGDNEVPHSSVDPLAMSDLLARAERGEAAPRAAFDKAGEALGFGIGRVIALLNPHRIVVAGPGLWARQLIEPAMRRAVEESVVEELRRDVAIEVVPVETDLILRGTTAALLRAADDDMSAMGSTRNERGQVAAE